MSADLVGSLVRLLQPSLAGPRSVAGRVTRILPDGRVEVRLQLGGYATVDRAALLPPRP